jgi:hypothetical protein
VRNFLCNIPLYLGLGTKLVGNTLINLSFKLHITFGTDAGKKLEKLQEATNELMKNIKEAKQNLKASSGDRKLVDILNGETTNGRSTFTTLGKKSDD